MLEKIAASRTRLSWIVGILLSVAWFVVYLSTVSPTVNFIDSGELISAAYEPGIAHPPGYPLYVLLGYVVSHVLWGSVAWRVNVLSAFFGAFAVGLMFLLLLEVADVVQGSLRAKPLAGRNARQRSGRNSPARKTSAQASGRGTTAPAQQLPVPESAWQPWWLPLAAAAVGASLLGASASFWSRTAQAKMYTLHYSFMLCLFFAALKARSAYDRDDRTSGQRWLIMLAAGLGFSLTNHLMTSLLVPGLLVLLLVGADWLARLRAMLQKWWLVAPALLLPLLLYLYLPLRASEGPVMNWGSPDNWGDFWRQVGGWQYRSYLLSDPGGTFQRILGFAGDQWSFLSWPLILLGLVTLVLLWRSAGPLAAATLLTAVLTLLFGVAYSISEIEPYMVPMYAIFVIWLATAPVVLAAQASTNRIPVPRDVTPSRLGLGAAALGALVAIAVAVLNYPLQNHSNDHLAELFDMNVFNSLPKDSIVLTDYWDFYAPSYYLQGIERVRPDLTLVDVLPLKYPWYSQQLEKLYPWLTKNSSDILASYRVEQRKWVNGENFDSNKLTQLYFGLLNSFVDRNIDTHPVFVLFTGGNQETDQVAQNLVHEPWGLTYRLLKQPTTDLPPAPEYDLRGITTDKVPLDDFARTNINHYIAAYQSLAQTYGAANQANAARSMSDKAAEIQAALKGR